MESCFFVCAYYRVKYQALPPISGRVRTIVSLSRHKDVDLFSIALYSILRIANTFQYSFQQQIQYIVGAISMNWWARLEFCPENLRLRAL